MLTGLLDRSSKQSLQYAYHSGIWFLAFFAAWVVQFHRTNYTYDYVTQSVHVATPDTSKHSYWTFDTLTHSQFKSAVGGEASMKSSINKNLRTLERKQCGGSRLARVGACVARGWLDYNRLLRELACVLLVVGLTITDSRASWRVRCVDGLTITDSRASWPVCCSWMA